MTEDGIEALTCNDWETSLDALLIIDFYSRTKPVRISKRKPFNAVRQKHERAHITMRMRSEAERIFKGHHRRNFDVDENSKLTQLEHRLNLPWMSQTHPDRTEIVLLHYHRRNHRSATKNQSSSEKR